MKRNYLALAALVALMACGNNTNDDGTGGSIDSNYSTPAPSTDNTTVQPESTINTMKDSTMKKNDEGGTPGAPKGATGQGAAPSASGAGTTNQGTGNSSGETGSGSATNSNNSGSTSDENKGTTR